MENQQLFEPLPGGTSTPPHPDTNGEKHPLIQWLETDGDLKDPFYNILMVLGRYPIEPRRWDKLIKRIGKSELPIETEVVQEERAVKVIKSIAEEMELWLIRNPDKMNANRKDHMRDVCATINTWYIWEKKRNGRNAYSHVK